MEGPSSHFPTRSLSKPQDPTASSTPEAFLVAAGTLVRTSVIPGLAIWEVLRRRWNKGGVVSYMKTMQRLLE